MGGTGYLLPVFPYSVIVGWHGLLVARVSLAQLTVIATEVKPSEIFTHFNATFHRNLHLQSPLTAFQIPAHNALTGMHQMRIYDINKS